MNNDDSYWANIVLISLSKDLIDSIPDCIKKWDSISRNKSLTDELIESYSDNLNWEFLYEHVLLSEYILNKYIHKANNWYHWYLISENQKLNLQFIETHRDKLSWHCISSLQELTEEFIEKYRDLVDWERISAKQILSEDFIERNLDKICMFSYLSNNKNINLSESFFERNKENLKHESLFGMIISKIALSKNFINTYLPIIDVYKLSKNKNVNEDIINMIPIDKRKNIDWLEMLTNCQFSKKFLIDNKKIYTNAFLGIDFGEVIYLQESLINYRAYY